MPIGPRDLAGGRQIQNACDNCDLDANPDQEDFDEDGLGDACDNCFFDRSPQQSDMDVDGQGDVCDLDDGVV